MRINGEVSTKKYLTKKDLKCGEVYRLKSEMTFGGHQLKDNLFLACSRSVMAGTMVQTMVSLDRGQRIDELLGDSLEWEHVPNAVLCFEKGE